MTYRNKALQYRNCDGLGFKYFRLGRRYEEATLSSMKQSISSEDMQFLVDWIKDPRGFLILIGPPGTGKTHLLASIYHYMEEAKARELEAQGDNPENSWGYFRIYSENHFLSEIKSCFDFENRQSPHDRLESICKTPIIFFDDLGSTNLRFDWQKNIFQEFVNERYNNIDSGTIFTTNHPKEKLLEMTDAKTIDRIFDVNFSKTIMVGGCSLRQIKEVKNAK